MNPLKMLLILMSFFLIASICLSAFFNVKKCACSTINSAKIIPKTEFQVITPSEKTTSRLADLSIIPHALEKHKQKYGTYPISSQRGNGWDGFHSRYGESNPIWIKGLVPEFLSSLPRDPRMNNSDSQQYLYKSDGANYKLIAHSPDDCYIVLKTFPNLVDPERNCWAYGYWTPKAHGW